MMSDGTHISIPWFLDLWILTIGETAPYTGCWFKEYTAFWRSLAQPCKVLPPSWHCNRVFKGSPLFSQASYFRMLGNHPKASLIAQLVKSPPAMQETPVRFLGWEIRWRRDRLPIPVFWGFLCSSAGRESASNGGDLSSIPGLGISPGEGKSYPLQYSGLDHSTDSIIHEVTKNQIRLSDFH